MKFTHTPVNLLKIQKKITSIRVPWKNGCRVLEMSTSKFTRPISGTHKHVMIGLHLCNSMVTVPYAIHFFSH